MSQSSRTPSLEEDLDKCHINDSDDRLQPSASTPINSTGTFGKTRKTKSDTIARRSANIGERRQNKKHYLIPIGSVRHGTDSKSPTRHKQWIDVASIMNQGTTVHKSLDTHQARHVVRHTTLSAGTITSVLTKKKLYAVLPFKDRMVTLEDILEMEEQSKVITEDHAKFVCANLMMALRFLHEHNIFHGSICPRKVVFNERGYPCLTGFGTADIIDDRQSRPREKTQFEYTSSEQLWWEHMTEVTDIYSTGCLIYALLYGRSPHRGVDTRTTRRNIEDGGFKPEFPPHTISRCGKKFIMKCIRKRESRRFSLLDTEDMFENVSWFGGLNEDKLYRQTIRSPMLNIIKKCTVKTGTE